MAVNVLGSMTIGESLLCPIAFHRKSEKQSKAYLVAQSNGENQLTIFRTLNFQIGLSVTIIVVLVGTMLSLGLSQSRRIELDEMNEALISELNNRYGVLVLGSPTAHEELFEHSSRHSFFLLLTAAFTTVIGTVLCFHFVAGRHIKRLIKNPGAFGESDYPGNELGELIKSKNLLISKLSRLSSIGELSAGIGHEIKSPLSVVRSNLKALNNRIDTKDLPTRHLVVSVEENINRIVIIVKGLERIARDSEHDDFELARPKEIFGDLISLVKPRLLRHDVKLRVDCDVNPTFLCKSAQITQVLVNLVNNSIDALEGDAPRWIKAGFSELENGVEFSVVDSGHGIDEEDVARIMNSFYTTKSADAGCGLGLSICRRLIKKVHQGDFWVDQECPNTRFVFTIPKLNKDSLPLSSSREVA